MKFKKRRFLSFSFIFLISACGSGTASNGDGSGGALPSFNYIAIGDSLTMGVQDGFPNEFTQTYSYAAVIAGQLSLKYGTSYVLPLLRTDGTRKNPEQIPTILGIAGEDSISLTDDKANPKPLDSQSSLHDKSLFPISSAANRNQPTSQLEAALWLADQWKGTDPAIPKIITFWIGNNDVLGAVVNPGSDNYTQNGILSQLTPPDMFRQNLIRAFDALKNAGATVFVGNVPNITDIAYLVSPDLVKKWTGRDIPADLMPSGSKMSLFAALNIYSDFLKGREWTETLHAWLNDASVMSASELQLISDRIVALNQVIDSLCGTYGFTKVDVYQNLRSPQTIDGVTFTNDWGGGNFFSLDGVHFSQSGYVVTANLFLQAINQKLKLNLPLPSVHQAWLQDPYRDFDQDGFPVGPTYLPVEHVTELLFKFKDQDDSNPNAGVLRSLFE